jgi:putative copper resistance protein D
MTHELLISDYASLLSKFFWYFAIAALAGGTLCFALVEDVSRRYLLSYMRYCLAGTIVAFQYVILYFLIQVGIANAEGISGMFDWSMVSFYLGLDIGETSLFRMAVLLVMLLMYPAIMVYLGKLTRPPTQRFFRFLQRFNIVCVLLLGLTFQATGHVAPEGFPFRLALVAHVISIALWAGSLYPLLLVSKIYPVERVQNILHKFSRVATIIVSILIISATIVAIGLLDTPSALFNTNYGRALLLKMCLVGLLLSLAALNRWRLCVNLTKEGYLQKLQLSIRGEMALVVMILLLTTYLSTTIGPGQV